MRSPNLFTLALSLSLLAADVTAQTQVSGIISESTTWGILGSPYQLVGNITINASATLTIDSGVEVELNGRKFTVRENGRLLGHNVAFGATTRTRAIEVYDSGVMQITNSAFDNADLYISPSDLTAGSTLDGNSFNVIPPFWINVQGPHHAIVNNTWPENASLNLFGTVEQDQTLYRYQSIPYRPSGTITIRGSATLAVEADVVVQLRQKLVVRENGRLVADQVTFWWGSRARAIEVYDSGVIQITNSAFDNADLYISPSDMSAGSTLDGNSFNVNPPFHVNVQGPHHTIVNNTFPQDANLYLYGTVSVDQTLYNYQSLPYRLSGTIGIEQTAALTIEPEVVVQLHSRKFIVRQSGRLVADRVTFWWGTRNRAIEIHDSGVIQITNSVFDNADLYITPSDMTAGSTLDGNSFNVIPPFHVNVQGPRHTIVNNTFSQDANLYLFGTVSQDQTLYNYQSLPYRLSGQILVNQTATLTIESGVEIQHQSDFVVRQDGRLVADGVTFWWGAHTAFAQVYDGGTLHVTNSSFDNTNVYLRNNDMTAASTIENNAFGSSTPIMLGAQAPHHTITGNTFAEDARIRVFGPIDQDQTLHEYQDLPYEIYTGVDVRGTATLTLPAGLEVLIGGASINLMTSSQLTARSVVFRSIDHVTRQAIQVLHDSHLELMSCTMDTTSLTFNQEATAVISNSDLVAGDNDDVVIRSVGTGLILAENNWWGATSGPYHEDLNPSGAGSVILGSVDFTPWLQSPVGLPTGPLATASPTFLDFGIVPVLSTADRTFTLGNAGDLNLEISQISISGADAAEFRVVSGGGAGTLIGGETRDVTVQYAPATEGVKSAKVVVESNDTASPLEITLAGRTDPPAMVTIGSLTIFADEMIDRGEGRHTATGNVSINEILKFTGALEVDTNVPKISGDGRVYVDGVPVVGEIDLYEGSFEFSLDGATLKGAALDEANNRLAMAGLSVHVDDISLLEDGIDIAGELELPDIIKHGGTSVDAKLSQVRVTRSSGLQVVGEVTVETEVSIHGAVTLRELGLGFDTINDIFSCSASLSTALLKQIEVATTVIRGQLDFISLIVGGDPIPVGSTGLSISEGGGSIGGLAVPPLKASLIVSLVPTAQGSLEIVEFERLTISYNFTDKIVEGTGSLNLLGEPVAQASVTITSDKIDVAGEVDLAGVVVGTASAAVSDADPGLDVTGSLDARVVIPDDDGVVYDLIDAFADLPYTVAKTTATLENTRVDGTVSVAGVDVTYWVEWQDDVLEYDFDTNWNPIPISLPWKTQAASIPFRVDGSMPALIIRVTGISGVPAYSVMMPTGEVLTADNAGRFESADYLVLEDELKSMFVVRTPALGRWIIELEREEQVDVDVFGADPPPSIRLGSLERSGNQVTVRWNESDPDSKSVVHLYYDNDGYGTNGVLIERDIPFEGGERTRSWDASAVPSGDYFVYGVIRDDVNAASVSYSPRPVRLLAAGAPTAPSNLTHSVTDTSITLSWNRGDAMGWYHNVYYSTAGAPDYDSPAFNVGYDQSFEFTNFEPGRTYRFAVTAMDTLYRESGFSNVAEVSYTSATLNNVPTILEQEFLATAYPQQAYSYPVETFDADDDPLSYDLMARPEGMTIDGGGTLSWIPGADQLGVYLIKLRVSDPSGASDSTRFTVAVLDSTSSRGTVAFDKTFFVGLEETATVRVADVNLNLSSTAVDSQRVRVYSAADPSGMELMAFETSAASAQFAAGFGFTSGQSAGSSIAVLDTDTLHAVYVDAFPSDTVRTVAYFYTVSPVSRERAEYVLPREYALDAAYPNPFNPSAYLQYALPEAAHVRLDVFDVAGRLVATVVDGEQAAGRYVVRWDTADSYHPLASGVYVYRIIADGLAERFIDARKLVLLK